jgi:dihydrofolate reductase
MTLDGYVAGPNARPGNPLGDGGAHMHDWMFRTATFVERLGAGGGGEQSPDDAIVQALFERAGAYVMGRRTFDEGEVGWPEDAPFRAPVFVLTHEARQPWARKGGTTFYFVTDGIHRALEQARAAAGGRDVRISGGAATIRQFAAAGLVDDFTIHIAPLLLGAGMRLFDQFGTVDIRLQQAAVSHSPLVTHVRYDVIARPQ